MPDPAILVEGLSKRYALGIAPSGSQSLRDLVSGLFQDPLGSFKRSTADDTLWALQDLNFAIQSGETVGILGHNGAGKSTLLKIIARITEPTEGRITLNGRVASLLEVGTGFHPELTGRENIFLNGAVLGMHRREIAAKFEEIVAFSEIARFIDTPVKRYSSGMHMRLAFAVAAHLEADILLVDEVLAVGDAAFQKKCLGKMDQVAHDGRTIFFVSHNTAAIRQLTRKCLYLDHGRLLDFGPSETILRQYLTDVLGNPDPSEDSIDFYRRDALQGKVVRFEKVWCAQPHLVPGQDLDLHMTIRAFVPVADANVTVSVKNALGQRVALFFSWDHDFRLTVAPGQHTLTLRIRGLPLAPGPYQVDIGINQSTHTVAYDMIVDYPVVKVGNDGQIAHWLERPWGAVHWSDATWEHEAGDV